MDRRTKDYIRQLMQTALTAPDPNQRRVAAITAKQLMDEDARRPEAHAIAPSYLDASPSPVAPSNTLHLDQVHPPITGDYVQPSIPPSRILIVPNVPLVPPGGAASDPARLDFSAAGGCDNGIVIGMKGSVRDDTAGVEAAGEYEYASIEVQITFNDSENIITDGEAASWVRYSDLFSPGQRNEFPIYREISPSDKMFFRWRNMQPAGEGNSLQPSLALLFRQKRYPGT